MYKHPYVYVDIDSYRHWYGSTWQKHYNDSHLSKDSLNISLNYNIMQHLASQKIFLMIFVNLQIKIIYWEYFQTSSH
jgi:hypothetical protein